MSRAWPFFEYDRIPERPEKLPLDEAAYRAMQKARWVVTEKIHGANFSFVTDGKLLRCAKRKAYLKPGESFYGYAAVRDRLAEPLRALFGDAQRAHPGIARLILYGELFGGGYPHPEVAPVEGVQPIQSGVYYSPRIEFCAFDLALVDEHGPRYLPAEELRNLCHAAEILCAEPLRVGSYEEALAYPVGFQSTLPARLGLPRLADNQAEGIVLKPAAPLYAEEKGQRVRILLKKKIPAFAEDERFSQAEKWRASGALSPLQLVQSALPGLVNENRLQSAVSKLGPPGARESQAWSALFQLVRDDVLLSLREEYGALWASLVDEEREQLLHDTEALVRGPLASYGQRIRHGWPRRPRPRR